MMSKPQVLPSAASVISWRRRGVGFNNLVLAGDWVKTALNARCAESAVMGGLDAARAIIDAR